MKIDFYFAGKNRFADLKKLSAFNQKISVFICVYLWTIFLCFAANAQMLAPGAPGLDAQWMTAGKQAVGTSANLESKVWFTLAEGVMTEVYYPDVTTANVHKLEFVVVNPKTRKVETETADATHEVKITRPDSLTFQQINTAKSGEWTITKTYTTDPENNSVLINVNFDTNNENLKIYLYYDPSLSNSGLHDTAWKDGDVLLAQDGDISSALLIGRSLGSNASEPLLASNGFYQVNDGLAQLKRNGKFTNSYARAENGNVAQTVEVINRLFARKPNGPLKPKNNTLWNNQFSVVLAFGKTPPEALQTAKSSARKGFQKCLAEYEKGWSDYVKTLPKVEPKYQAQFNMAAMQLRAHEDKTVRGANIASLSVPWGGGSNANENTVGGYHLVWSRDLYQVATAFMALGDMAAANRALDFVFKVQQKPDGSVPQNSKLDGTPYWTSLQHDEVAFPLILAYQLKRFDKPTWENHVKRAADFIVRTGPGTPQERWEEEGGYSPSTIAAEIAGLVCAAEIARKNGDETSANLYLKTADEWQGNVEKWTATRSGKYGDGNYYLRITQNGKPDAGDKIEINNGAGFYDEREIVDAGFLELVRLGIKSPDDPLIQKSLKVIDQIIKINTPHGEAFYRYNHDGYGEMDDGRRWNFDGKYTGKGRLWALLSGERGQYELALAKNGKWKMENGKSENKIQNPKSKIQNQEFLTKAKSRLDAMLGFANDGLMIPEQAWDKANEPKNIDKQFIPELKFGEGTGSATPLAWSMAQFIRLAVNLQAGRNLDTPDVVYNRYVLGKKNTVSQKNYLVFEKCQYDFGWQYSDSGIPIKAYWMNYNTSPMFCINANTVFLFYEGAAKNVEIVGDFTNWKSQEYKFGKLSNSQSFIELEFAPTARVEYKFIIDGKWITDPLNPNKVDNGVGGENSFFTMPEYKPTVWADASGMTKPAIEKIAVNSKVYDAREIQVYVPENFEKQSLPVMYLQDGGDYLKRADAITIQRNLVKANKIKPFIMVFVDYKDRMKEYWASDDYAKFLATEVVPAIDKQYNTIKSRDGRAILGASLGGITSVHTALKYPEVFSRVGGQSSSFWIDNERVVKELETLDSAKNKFRFYFDDGTLEGVEDSRKVTQILRGKGFEVTYSEAETGHNWTSWRDRLADAFVALWQ